MFKEVGRELARGGIEGKTWAVNANAKIRTDSYAKSVRIILLADVSGMSPEYHVGDEAMAEVLIDRLKLLTQETRLVMACAKPEAIQATYGIKSFAHYNLTNTTRRKLWRQKPLSALKSLLLLIYQLLRCDLVVVCGGGNLTSVWPDVLESRLYFLSWARRLKRPFYLFSQTLGPFHKEHRQQAENILSAAQWIGVRDKGFSATQVSLPVQFAVDDAVFLPAQHSVDSRKMMAELKDSMAVSLREFGTADQNHLMKLGRNINAIALQHQLSTVFIPHHSPQGGGDTSIGLQLQLSWQGKQRFQILHPIPFASELKAITADCKLVITMRYHQLIFALSAGIPAVGIYVNEYTQAKLNGAFEQFKLPPRTLSIDEADDKLALMIPALLKEVDTFREASQSILHDAFNENIQGINQLKELHLSG